MGMLDTLKGWIGKLPKKRDNYAATYGNGNSNGFAGGAVSRLTASMANWSGAVNLDLDASLVIMRARARQLAQSDEYGRRFLSMVATNVVGHSGPQLQVRAYMAQPDKKGNPVLDKSANDAIEIHWKKWGKTADIGGRMNFAHLMRVTAKSVARDGEALIRKVRDRSLPYGYALQLLEADRLAETINVIQGSSTIRQGVEIDSTGRPVAYWVHTTHPGDRYNVGASNIERIPASDIIHVFLPERAEQVRGYTWFHAILMRANQLHGYNEAAVTAARIGASKVAALERDPDSAPAIDSMADASNGGAIQMNVEAGEMFELPPGYKLSSWNPEYPHANYESFVKASMRGISAGLDVATHNLSGDMTDVNYSSARIAELSEREQWVILQDWFIAATCEKIFEDWLAVSMLRGDITFEQSGKSLPADKFSKFLNASKFQGRRWSWVDPSKEVEASEKLIAAGLASRSEIAASQGKDFDDIVEALKYEKEALDAAGLSQANLQQSQPNAAPADNTTTGA
jgi:lambda family phage portal protein